MGLDGWKKAIVVIHKYETKCVWEKVKYKENTEF